MIKLSKTIFSVLAVLSFSWAQSSVFAQDYIGGNFQLKDPLDTADAYCFDLFGFGMNLEMSEVISARTCKNPGWPDTTFRVDYPDQGNIYAIDLDRCVQATNLARGAHLIMQPCSSTHLQQFIYADDQTVRLRSEDNTRELCLVVNPAAGLPMDGAGLHLRREILLYECGRAELAHAQWIIPEGSEFSAPLAAKSELSLGSSAPEVPGQAVYLSACSRCHGVNAEGREDMQSPKLSGLSAEYIKIQFYNFINGQRGAGDSERWAAQMAYYVDTLPERHLAAMDDVVAYIEALPEFEVAQTISGDSIAGETIYQSQCALCHSDDGLGVADLNSPSLAGIQDWYLLKQLEKFRDGRRGAHPDDALGAQMVPFAKTLSDEDMHNIVAHINQL